MTVCLRIRDTALCRLVRILLREYADRRGISAKLSDETDGDTALLLCDEAFDGAASVPMLRLGREQGDLLFPFPREEFFRLLDRTLCQKKTPAPGSVLLPTGVLCALTEGEWAILTALIQNEGETVSRRDLGVEEGSLNVLLHRLREKLERDGQKRIFAVRGVGYRLERKGLLCRVPGKEGKEC